MTYTNSPLVDYTKLSPNHSGQRTHSIDRITPHCVVGQCSVETLGSIFTPTSKQASCNYGIGSDGRVALIVEEKNRSWCSSSSANDQRAITIECASDNTEPYAFKDVVYQKLITLCVDICKRNGKTKLIWLGDKDKTLNYTPASGEMVLTVHRWFANKSCPGSWMYARMGDLAAKVTAQLGAGPSDANTSSYTKIMGTAAATAAQMQTYIKTVNPSVAQSVIDMIPLYLSEGAAEGVRGDIAFAQSCLETRNFGFSGSAVTLDQNNFCGMGVTANGMKGNSFDTPQMGIRAQIQHLKAYASKDALKNALVDPRFQYVTRGCAEYVEWLGQQENPAGKGWAVGVGYGSKILAILKKVVGTITGSGSTDSGSAEYPEKLTSGYYRVRKTWADSKSQLGAYRVLSNAKTQADKNPGYYVFTDNGVSIYPAAAACREYTVQKGDSLWAIAQRLLGSGTRYREIKALNDLTSDTIYSGQKLKIPN